MRLARLVAPLGMVAALTLSLASSAAAAPGSLEFGKCVRQAGGRFANGGCTKVAKPGSGIFEWTPLTSTLRSTLTKEKATASFVLEGASGTEISCRGLTQREGEFGPASKEESNLVWVFTGCQALGGGCRSTGASAEEIVWSKLRAVPGIVTTAPKEELDVVGLAFSPQSGTVDAEFECGPAPVIVSGGMIVKVQEDEKSAVNKMKGSYELEFVSARPGKQIPEEFVGGPRQTLEWSLARSIEPVALTGIALQKTSPSTEKIELRHCEANVC